MGQYLGKQYVRKTKLDGATWDIVKQRYYDGEKAIALAKEYGVSASYIYTICVARKDSYGLLKREF